MRDFLIGLGECASRVLEISARGTRLSPGYRRTIAASSDDTSDPAYPPTSTAQYLATRGGQIAKLISIYRGQELLDIKIRPCDMDPFEYNINPSRVVFGSGSINKLPEEIKKLECSSPLVLTSKGQNGNLHGEFLTEILSKCSMSAAAILNMAVMHTPVPITEAALQQLKAQAADCIVTIGGGSVVGLGKALSIRTGLQHICIPTTYSGSEMTPILGETDNGRKTTRSDPKIIPGVVIYDADLTRTLPVAICSTSGINAIAHAVEALYAKNTNPITNLLALEGIKKLAEALPAIVQDPSDLSARERAQYGAWLCGVCLGTSAMALHHKLCHTLGGSFNLPHAETHTIMLPHALAYNAPAIPEQMQRIASVLPDSDGDAIKGLDILLNKLGVSRALKDFGMQEEDIDKATEIAMGVQYANPRAMDKNGIRELIRRAWAGEPARADL
ncbi:maleylacetate reductase [Aureobasidium subglaciale]|nr:maleylacetate reductase [Aureobasidium subglaciale]